MLRKFWRRPSKDGRTTVIARPVAPFRIDPQYFERKKEIHAWRDYYEIAVFKTLKNEAPLLKLRLRTLVQNAKHRELFLRRRKWVFATVHPAIRDWAEQQAIAILEPASKEALAILRARGDVKHSERSVATDKMFDQLTDLASALGPMAGAILVIPKTISASVVSAGGLIGLFGATTIAWPIAIGGGLLIAISVVFGGYRLASLRQHANERIYRSLSQTVDSQVFKTSEKEPCLCEKLQEIIRETARQQLKES